MDPTLGSSNLSFLINSLFLLIHQLQRRMKKTVPTCILSARL